MEEDIKYNSEELNLAYLNSNIHRLYSKDKPLSPQDPLVMAFLPWKKLGKLGALFGIKKLSDDAYDKYQKRLQEKETSELKNKKRLLPKGLTGWLTAAIAENPAVMTAAGYKVEPSGEVIYLEPNKKLAHNLSTIGEAAITAPTMVADAAALTKLIPKTAKDFWWFIRHPGAVKVYHVNRNGISFPLQLAKTGSAANIGIHVSPKKEIVLSFNSNAPVMEAYIPKEDMQTIDIMANDYNLFSNDYKLGRTYGLFALNDPKGLGASVLSYFTTPGDKLRFNLIKRYGGNPSISDDGLHMYLDNDVTIPLLKETWPDMPIKARQQMDDIIAEGVSIDLNPGETYASKAERLNLKAAKIVSDNGKKVIKYHNANFSEGGGGVSYIVTDPKVFYNPLKYNFSLILKAGINYSKYPITYEINL